jgi:hypothetical protein
MVAQMEDQDIQLREETQQLQKSIVFFKKIKSIHPCN